MSSESDTSNTIIKTLRLLITNFQKLNEKVHTKFQDYDTQLNQLSDQLRGVQNHLSKLDEQLSQYTANSSALNIEKTSEQVPSEEFQRMEEELNLLKSEVNALKSSIQEMKKAGKVTPELIEKSLESGLQAPSKKEPLTETVPSPPTDIPKAPTISQLGSVETRIEGSEAETRAETPVSIQDQPKPPVTSPISKPVQETKPIEPPTQPSSQAQKQTQPPQSATSMTLDTKPLSSTVDDPEQKDLLEALKKLESL